MVVLSFQWVLQVIFPSACSFIVLIVTVSLHVSAYMAIFKCVRYFIFICLKDSAAAIDMVSCNAYRTDGTPAIVDGTPRVLP
jgi:hypothetical protein